MRLPCFSSCRTMSQKMHRSLSFNHSSADFNSYFLRRLRNEFSLTQDDPALCDGIFAKFHAVSLTGIARGCGPLLQPVTVPDGSFAGVISHFEILRQLQRIRRTGILAQPAEHAPRGVIGEVLQHFSSRRIVALR